jgi:LCP family protein required for cell wall assembly
VRTRSASVAVFLSFLWPGLGQWYLGRHRAAVAYGLPATVAMAALAWQFSAGLETLALRLLAPSFALTVLIIVVLLGILRVLSMLEATLRLGPAGRWRGPRATTFLAALVALVVVTHGVVGYGAWAFYDAGSRIFVGGSDSNGIPNPTGPLGAPGSSLNPGDLEENDFQATPDATPASDIARVTVLFTGIDSGAGRLHALTDTLLVVSFEPQTQHVTMVSFPRDIASFSLYDGRIYTGKINALMTSARLYPSQYPDGPLPTLTKELGYLLGVPINYFAAINLDGFTRMVDLVEGVDVVNPKAIADPTYDWLDGTHGFYLAAGKVHLDGRTALAYVRSRKGAGDSDYTRAARQQDLLVALRKKLVQPSMLLRVPALLDAASRTIKTNFPADRVDDMLALARSTDDGNIERFVLSSPYSYHPPTTSTGGSWELRLQMDRLAALSVQLFGQDSRYYQGASASP